MSKLLQYQRKIAYQAWKKEVEAINGLDATTERVLRLGELNHRIATYEANFIENKL